MRTSRIASCSVMLLVLGATSTVDAADLPCEKNHYILEVTCTDSAVDASIGSPGAVATDVFGNVYFSSPNIVFKLDSTGRLTRVAGNGIAGYAGDGGPATEALLSFPKEYPELIQDPFDFAELVGALAVDAVGNLYIADAYNNRVRKVDLSGIITTIAGNGDQNYFADDVDGRPAKDAAIWWPQGLAVDTTGNLYVASAFPLLEKVMPNGVIATLAWSNCGPGYLGPGLCGPEGIAVTASGDIFVADGYCRVREVKADGSIYTVAGADKRYDGGFAFTCGYTGDSGSATAVGLAWPFSVSVDPIGNLYIADTYNSCIRKVDSAGIITTAAGTCGPRSQGYSGDGDPAIGASLNHPHGVAVDVAGSLYIADTDNNRIRKVGADGVITTIAGNGN
jgi:trimeric autotransporter adhesin